MRRTAGWLALAAVGIAGLAMVSTGWAKPEPAHLTPVPMRAWRMPGARTLEADLGRHTLRLPLQAVRDVQVGRGGDGERVVMVSAVFALSGLNGGGDEARPRLLALRLYADIPPGMMERQAHTLALSLQRSLYRDVTQGGWQGLQLYAMADPRQPPLMEGFFEANGRRRYVECRLAGSWPDCSATYQRDDGLTVEYTFDLVHLGHMAWLDAEVTKLLTSFVTR